MKKFLDFFFNSIDEQLFEFYFHFHSLLFAILLCTRFSCVLCKVFCNGLTRVYISSHPASQAAAVRNRLDFSQASSDSAKRTTRVPGNPEGV